MRQNYFYMYCKYVSIKESEQTNFDSAMKHYVLERERKWKSLVLKPPVTIAHVKTEF